ncbi:MAG: hypothetical protein V1722_02535 [Candidatus Micrarchaeota archaeon]
MRELKAQLERTLKVKVTGEGDDTHFTLPRRFTLKRVKQIAARHGYNANEEEIGPGLVKGRQICVSPKESQGVHLFFERKGKATQVRIIQIGESRAAHFLAGLHALMEGSEKGIPVVKAPPQSKKKAMGLNAVHRQQVIGFLSALTAKRGKGTVLH